MRPGARVAPLAPPNREGTFVVSDKLWAQISAASGIVFVVLVLAGAFIQPQPPPSTDDSIDKIIKYFTDDRARILTGSYLIGFSTVFLLWFLGTLRLALMKSGATRLPVTAVGAGIAAVALVLVANGVNETLAFRTAAERNPDVVHALFDVSAMVFLQVGFAVGTFVLAASVVMIRWKAVSQWLGYAGVVVAVLNYIDAGALAKSGALSPAGVFGLICFLGFAAWVLVASVLLTLQAGKEPAAA
jgi:hypothetical protein